MKRFITFLHVVQVNRSIFLRILFGSGPIFAVSVAAAICSIFCWLLCGSFVFIGMMGFTSDMLEIRVSMNLPICFGGLDTRPDRVREPVNEMH